MNPQQTPIPVLDDSDSAVHAEFKKPIEFFGNLIPHWIISNSGGSKVHFEFPTFKGFKDPQTRVTVESEQAMVDAWVMGINGSPPIRAWEIVPSEHGLVVLDLDTHGGDGFATLRELSNRSGIEVAESFYTLSPEHPCFEITSRDGIHLYFKWDGPTLPKGLLGKGIEILQDSVFVAGSKKYPDKPQTRLVGSYGEIPKVPQFLQDLFEFCLNEKESVEPEARSENWIQDFQKNNLGTNDVFEQARRIFPSRIESLFKTDGAYWKNANYHTLSPLRNDQHIGSFSVNEDGRWYDFATQESGDGISLVARWKNLSLLESAKFIIGEKTESHFLSDSEELAQEPQQRRTDLFPLVHISQMRVTKPNWLIDKFIESATLVGLFGESGSYKTFLALSMAMAVASGKDWYGHNTQQGAVLYLIGEGKDGFIRRINAWGKENAVDPKKIPFYSYSTDSVMDNQYSVQKLIDSIRESVTVSLRAIFVDTLARALGDAEENSSRDINRFANLCKRLQESLGCAVVLVHHTGHGETKRARGSSAFKASLDHEYRTDKDAKDGVALVCTKMKDSDPPAPMAFTKKEVVLGRESNGYEYRSIVLNQVPVKDGAKAQTLGKNESEILEIWEESFNEKAKEVPDLDRNSFYVPLSELSEVFRSKDKPKNSFYKAKKSLIEKGRIWIDPNERVFIKEKE